ncbi:(R)-mandelonitrile lyase [Alteromonas halophila]|uniref:Cupin type-2 domain-containing protein n=1 Tax=Alteromonas halophila TaxID=516698 RepID=A0A918JQN0_9ALTE|nr:cupin domain-containing protein [Alteromonas halophila]GGW93813.1 hypothetical protein GCM10007391_30140 [Alteromonas halophila]
MKMGPLISTALLSVAFGSTCTSAATPQSLTLKKVSEYQAGPAKYFTGDVMVGSFFDSKKGDYKGAIVNFSPGAYTNWHTHPRGQTLVITEGTGRAQSEGSAIQTLQKGDTVWIPANVRHWHGAAPEVSMSHIAIQAPDENGNVVNWMEKVDPATYAPDQ